MYPRSRAGPSPFYVPQWPRGLTGTLPPTYHCCLRHYEFPPQILLLLLLPLSANSCVSGWSGTPLIRNRAITGVGFPFDRTQRSTTLQPRSRV